MKTEFQWEEKRRLDKRTTQKEKHQRKKLRMSNAVFSCFPPIVPSLSCEERSRRACIITTSLEPAAGRTKESKVPDLDRSSRSVAPRGNEAGCLWLKIGAENKV